ncbi:hypothetical protein [Streptomyces cupreus]|uniref:Uncharacterized protein n=1 Tax=Streptomyces cupreus TaxID=2759956 RepID=A0A7X1J2R5_9ACTN|nr:hypothetical protein [Streptomyces cupreus]MBC2903161.1 hypothetical protein [Streptomyces cupreus]
MSALPERYQRYAHPGQPAVRLGEVELRDDRDPVVYVPDAYGQMVPMRRSQLPAAPSRTEPRDLAPQPLLDPVAQRILSGGLGVGAAGAGLGWGAGQVFAGMALMGTSGLLLFLGLLLAAGVRGRGGMHVHQEVHNHARWFGRNTTNL